jgi:hypothetical protein
MNTQDLKQLFWDTDEKDLPSIGKNTIIARTLTYGTYAQIKALSAYGKEAIRAVFLSLKQGALSDRRRDYFSIILS